MAAALPLLLSYSLCIIVAGHGAVPLGAILLTGRMDAWFAVGKIMGWIAIACLIAGTLLLRTKPTRQGGWQLACALLLYAFWLDIARREEYESGSFLSTFISLPFQIIFFVIVTRLVIALSRSRLA